jgi:predicted RNase H-like nuclease (RuvC/YqgF family)
MTRKRLSDLLREEVQKSPEPEVELQETNGDQLLEEVSSTAEKSTVEVQKTFEDAEATDESPINPPAKSSARRTTKTMKTDLEVTVTELRERLKEAQQKESSQQQQISDLQFTLQEQKTLIQQLQSELEQKNQLKLALEQVKKDALQLAEANEKLNQELNALKKEDGKLKAQVTQGRPQKLIKLDLAQAEKSADSSATDNFQSWCYD